GPLSINTLRDVLQMRLDVALGHAEHMRQLARGTRLPVDGLRNLLPDRERDVGHHTNLTCATSVSCAPGSDASRVGRPADRDGISAAADTRPPACRSRARGTWSGSSDVRA